MVVSEAALTTTTIRVVFFVSPVEETGRNSAVDDDVSFDAIDVEESAADDDDDSTLEAVEEEDTIIGAVDDDSMDDDDDDTTPAVDEDEGTEMLAQRGSSLGWTHVRHEVCPANG